MANLGRGAVGQAFRTGSIFTGVGGQVHELCRGDPGQQLTVLWDGTLGWTTPAGPGPEKLNDLIDVNIPSPKCGDVMLYDGTEWKNYPFKKPAFEFFMG